MYAEKLKQKKSVKQIKFQKWKTEFIASITWFYTMCTI